MAISLHSGLVEGRSPFKNSASLTLPELEKASVRERFCRPAPNCNVRKNHIYAGKIAQIKATPASLVGDLHEQ